MDGHDPVKRAIAFLNDALERDPDAITRLFNARVECNEKMINHPTIQVGVYDDEFKLGVLGLINGLFGYKRGGIGAEGEVDTSTKRFTRIRRFVDTRTGVRLDV